MAFLLVHSGGRQSPAAEQVTTDPSVASGRKPRSAENKFLEVALIDRHLRQVWTDEKIVPSLAATDGEWCRRVYLDLIGRIPSVVELQRYLKNRSPGKRSALVDTLLGEQYVEEYARNWSTLWTNILIGRTGGTERDSLTSRGGMTQYLRDCFVGNKPYDSMVYELITATGKTKPENRGFNGAANFLTMKLSDKGVLATSKTSQVFLGIQVQCTQCHPHPFNNWKQSQFWQLNAFFRQTRALRRFRGREIAEVTLADEDFVGEGGNPAEAELYYELRNGQVKVAYPVFLDGTALTEVMQGPIGNSGYLEDINRRVQLAKLVVKSPWLEKAIVNRIWAHFFGYGFTKPMDDLGPHNPPSHPELLDALGAQFRSVRFDLKELMRWITLSEAYGLSSRRRAKNQHDDPELGEPPMFSHFYLRQMRAEELYESLIVATAAHKTQSSYDDQEEAKRKWLKQFVRAFGTDENDETTTFNGTIPQALMMMNGDLVRRATSAQPGSFLFEIANSDSRNSAKIRHLYLAALARAPAPRELRLANGLLTLRDGNIPQALRDIWWALLNSNEFILNH